MGWLRTFGGRGVLEEDEELAEGVGQQAVQHPALELLQQRHQRPPEQPPEQLPHLLARAEGGQWRYLATSWCMKKESMLLFYTIRAAAKSLTGPGPQRGR
jgi:hypothetical protein